VTKNLLYFISIFLNLIIQFTLKCQVVSLSDSVEVIAAADTGLIVAEDLDTNLIKSLRNFDYFNEYIPEVTEELIKDRLNCVQGEIKLLYNPKINSFIDFFVRRRRDYALLMLQRKNLYFPIIEQILKKYGMPDELKYLAVVESGLKPTALSPSNALGLWQFIPSTGKLYGLRIDNYIDERLNIEKSTESACRYLKWLYNAFGDWHLALASYNCGPGYVQSAIKKAGGKSDFWKIYDYLPQETRSYVPQFIAVSYFMQYHEEHNLFPQFYEHRMKTDTVLISGYCDLSTLAILLGLCPEDLNKINLELKKNIIPKDLKHYPVNLPIDVIPYFKENRTRLLDSCSKVKAPEIFNKSHKYETEKGLNDTYTYDKKFIHKVQRGESLGIISMKYRVSMHHIKRWNNLTSDKLKVGQKLVIYTGQKHKINNPVPFKHTKPIIQSRASALNKNTTQNSKIRQTNSASKTIYHVVQSGDTLYQISKKYGVSIESIRKNNNIKNNKLILGQKLAIIF
jgi:membrane-bound lytic murein transglycosylase D